MPLRISSRATHVLSHVTGKNEYWLISYLNRQPSPGTCTLQLGAAHHVAASDCDAAAEAPGHGVRKDSAGGTWQPTKKQAQHGSFEQDNRQKGQSGLPSLHQQCIPPVANDVICYNSTSSHRAGKHDGLDACIVHLPDGASSSTMWRRPWQLASQDASASPGAVSPCTSRAQTVKSG